MRFIAALVSSASLLALTNAQTDSSASLTSSEAIAPSSTSAAAVSGTQPLTPAQSSQAACLSACPATDPSCRAHCVSIGQPSGNYAGQNSTIDCVSSCDKGNGTAAENLAYENCLKGCVASASIAHTAAPTMAPTAAGTGGSETGAGRGNAGPTGTESGAVATGTSSAPASTSSKGAAETLRVGVSVAGVLGVFVAVFAL